MTNQWRKPDASEAAQGFIAMLRESYFCMNGRAETWPDGKILRESGFRWTGYTALRLQRRMSWGGDMPPFIEIGQKERAA